MSCVFLLFMRDIIFLTSKADVGYRVNVKSVFGRLFSSNCIALSLVCGPRLVLTFSPTLAKKSFNSSAERLVFVAFTGLVTSFFIIFQTVFILLSDSCMRPRWCCFLPNSIFCRRICIIELKTIGE
ncbi:hypothetical protein HHI36_005662 [Cryptolaemus montrouzieri]|uniref:Uncharacterized protein n=1 Tax=Cryptolaemus montrouzieri TaxID=559131 RepID=A0ABD2NV10_9CUCU